MLLAGVAARAQAPTWQVLSTIERLSGSDCTITAIDAADWQTVWVAGIFEGSIRLGGTQLTSAGGMDGFVARWNMTTNSFTWAARFGGSADEFAGTLVVNGYQVYLAGHFYSPTATFGSRSLTQTSSPGEADGFVVKIADANTSPYFQWAQAVAGPGQEQINSLSVSGRQVVVGGSFTSATARLGTVTLANLGIPGSADGFVAELNDTDTAGNFTWAWGVSGSSKEQVTSVLHGGTAIYYGGEFDSPTLRTGTTTLTHSSPVVGPDVFLGALKTGNAPVASAWAYQAGGAGIDYLSTLGRAGQGFYATGSFSGATATFGPHTLTNTNPAGTSSDAFLTRLNDLGTTGSFGWAVKAGGPGSDSGQAVDFATNGSVRLVGMFEGTAAFGPHQLTSQGGYDIFVTRLDDTPSSASFAWAQRAGGPGTDLALAVLPGFQNRIYVAGSSTPPAQFSALPVPGPAQVRIGYLATLLDAGPSLTASISGEALLCAGGQLTLTAAASAGVQSYRWNTGASTASITVTQPGVYSVVATFGNGETRTAQHTVAAFVPAVQLVGDSVVCGGSAVQLTAVASGATSFLWNTGATTAALSISQPGTYTLTARFGGGCALTRKVVVRAAALAVTGPAQLCSGAAGSLTATAPGATAYRWNTGGTSATLPITQAGSYTVQATFASGCTLSATHTVTAPAARLSGDSVGCAGQPVRLRATQAGASGYRWSTGETDSIVYVRQTGSYTVTVDYPGGCQSQATTYVRMAPELPVFTLGPDTILCEGERLLLKPLLPEALLRHATYRWSTGATTPTIWAQGAGTYVLQLQTSCGMRTASLRAESRTCLTIPNVITPNGDQFNEHFAIAGLQGAWSLQVFNRWGKRVFQTEAYANDWGPNTAPGRYYYLLARPGQPTVYKGWLEVIR
ncbi:gliding motility-associated C-terminal domain-containing protein [Hymenobacter lucidus]|uniref:Gliding motility-associated C-terminal domain-containing protein n=1 Tax=Hymenobacter lucidus TaxID=2880930 RepID=A0ABS8AUB1_9BACT|nr:gliding motility-associated C-terminal domain-containing protein [Hymenobacter lucidus]MCB2409810.1 gliding motility-associated C-terminal domain-containing protein [Hymenobacter lucidus]